MGLARAAREAVQAGFGSRLARGSGLLKQPVELIVRDGSGHLVAPADRILVIVDQPVKAFGAIVPQRRRGPQLVD